MVHVLDGWWSIATCTDMGYFNYEIHRQDILGKGHCRYTVFNSACTTMDGSWV